MPFINGRYHINPIAGEALEAAREAEAALLALGNATRENSDNGNSSRREINGDFADDNAANQSASPQGPIHRVEIEAAELVPSHTGRAGRGFVARVHRSVIAAPNGAGGNAAPALFSSRGPALSRIGAAPANSAGSSTIAVRPETHVFTNHADLLNFLQDELSREESNR